MHSHNIKNSRRGLSFVMVALCVLAQFATTASAQEDKRQDEPRYAELPNFHQVNARLLRGGQPHKDGMQKLSALGVNTVINLRDDDERAQAEGLEARAAGLRYFNIPFGRLGRPTDEQVEHVLSLINAPENGVVFVHCAHGADRTGTVIAIYRISHDGWAGEQATREAQHYGMKFWQRGMKDYISDYYRDHTPPTNPTQPERTGHGMLSLRQQPTQVVANGDEQ
jgi:protein tyrosine/serine phosphatase